MMLGMEKVNLSHTLYLAGSFTELYFSMPVMESVRETWIRLGCTSIVQTMEPTACFMTMMR
jgi:hypothetical protein